MKDVYEISSVCQVISDGPVTAAAFDPGFELLWSGSSLVRKNSISRWKQDIKKNRFVRFQESMMHFARVASKVQPALLWSVTRHGELKFSQ